MISQGYPLWATDDHGDTYAVVGWEDAGAGFYEPVLIELGSVTEGACGPGRMSPVPDITYATTDPGESGQGDVAELRRSPRGAEERYIREARIDWTRSARPGQRARFERWYWRRDRLPV